MIKDLARVESDGIGLDELKKLYTTYLKELCPNWSDERIKTEVRDVFKEQGLGKSKQRRQEFTASILRKLEQIRTHPDDWFIGQNGHRT